MAQQQVDTIDVAGLVLFPIAAGVVLGIWTMDVSVFGGWSPDDVLFTAAGVEATWAFLGTVLAVAWIVGTNEIDGSSYEGWEYGIIAFAFLAVPLYEFVPAVTEVINSHDAIAVLVWLTTAVAATYIAYTD